MTNHIIQIILQFSEVYHHPYVIEKKWRNPTISRAVIFIIKLMKIDVIRYSVLQMHLKIQIIFVVPSYLWLNCTSILSNELLVFQHFWKSLKSGSLKFVLIPKNWVSPNPMLKSMSCLRSLASNMIHQPCFLIQLRMLLYYLRKASTHSFTIKLRLITQNFGQKSTTTTLLASEVLSAPS